MAVSDVSSNQNESYIEILKSFNRNTTINDVNGLMAKSLFMIYDLKDEISGKRDGKFDDREWALFEQFRNAVLANEQKNSKNKVNKKAVKYFQKQVENFEKTVEELSKKYNSLFKTDYFKELDNFEVSHNLVFHGLKEGEEAPEGAFVLEDIEPFGIGIEQEDKGCFEGIYKKAYIEGVDELAPEEQQEYKEKVLMALKWCQKTREFEENIFGPEMDKLQDAIILLNASKDGILGDDYQSEEKCNEILERYKAENPYLKQIENIDNQINKERLKLNPNTAKIKELESIKIGLVQASDQWRLKFSSEDIQPVQAEKAQLSASGSVSGIHEDEEGEDSFVTSQSVNINYGNEKAGVNISGSIDNKYSTSDDTQESSNQTVYKGGIASYFKHNRFSVNQNSTLIINPDYKMQNHELKFKLANTELGLSQNIRQMNVEEYNHLTAQSEQISKTVTTTSVSLSQEIGNANIDGSIQFANEGTTYMVNGGYNYEKGLNNFNISLTPNAGISYTKAAKTDSPSDTGNFDCEQPEMLGENGYKQGDVYMANAGLNANLEYKFRNFNAVLNINDNISTQFPGLNNTFSATASAKYKGFGFKLTENHTYSSERKTNTILTGINYTGEYGDIEAAYSHTRTSMPMQNDFGEMVSNVTHGKKFTITVRLLIDKLFRRR